MNRLVRTITARALPAFLTALGVVLITAGLLTYSSPTTAGTAVVETPDVVEISEPPSEDPSTSLEPSLEASPSASLDPSASPTAGPTATPAPTKKPSGRETATRVVMPALNIDLAVVKGVNSYPYCNVAMYLTTKTSSNPDDAFGQPPEKKVTYIYAHARDGMFGPIYELSIVKGTPNRMLGMIVLVYTNYNKLYTYEVIQVRRHVTSLEPALTRNRQEVWLQTSEGPKGTPGKTQVIAKLLSVEASTQAESQPKPRIVRCG